MSCSKVLPPLLSPCLKIPVQKYFFCGFETGWQQYCPFGKFWSAFRIVKNRIFQGANFGHNYLTNIVPTNKWSRCIADDITKYWILDKVWIFIVGHHYLLTKFDLTPFNAKITYFDSWLNYLMFQILTDLFNFIEYLDSDMQWPWNFPQA